MSFWFVEAIAVVLQSLLFIPVYVVWRNDAKAFGKENLAVSLSERAFIWFIYVPIWAVPIVSLVV